MEPRRGPASVIGGMFLIGVFPVAMIWGFIVSGPIGIPVGAGFAIVALTALRMLIGPGRS